MPNSRLPIFVLVVTVLVVAVAGAWLFVRATAVEDAPLDPRGLELCPPGFAYQEGGLFHVERRGDHWGKAGKKEYDLDLQPYCLAQFEASRPEATAAWAGMQRGGLDVFPAQVKKGVLPWVSVSWVEALMAVTQQGWRLPTFEELQASASGGDPQRVWIFGSEWDCRQAERSWFETCDGVRPVEIGPMPTGGPQGTSNYGTPFYDFLGNVMEMTSTPWAAACDGFTRFSLFGGAFLTGHADPWTNMAMPDPEGSGCLRFFAFSGDIHGEHEHHFLNRSYNDDGFRPAADPSPKWKNRQPLVAPVPVAFPITAWYYDPDTGRRVEYAIARPPEITTNRQ